MTGIARDRTGAAPAARTATALVMLAAVLVLLVAGSARAGAGGTILRVDDDAPPGGDGATWTTAHAHLQDALAVAAASGGTITEIRVAGGVHRPDRSDAAPAGTGDRSLSFMLASGLAIRGGHLGLDAGDGEDPDDRDPVGHPTTLSGDLAGDDGPAFTGNAENSYHVVRGAGVDATAVLDGVTIAAGHADGAEPDDWGGGLFLVDASATFIECRIADNLAAFQGGGVQLKEGSDATFTACTFIGNRAGDNGGAVYSGASVSVFTECVFLGNAGAKYAGGICNRDGSDSVFDHCTFTMNVAAETAEDGGGGGAMVNARSHPTLLECTFSGNTALFGKGGALVNEPGFDPALGGSNPVVIGCLFDGNDAIRGGAIYNLASAPVFDGCVIRDNHSESGAGVYNLFADAVLVDCLLEGNRADVDDRDNGGGVYNFVSSPTITRCVFRANEADCGAGLYNVTMSHPVVTSCTFHANTAVNGAGVYSDNFSDPVLVNCVITANRATEAGGGVTAYYTDATRFVNCTVVANEAPIGGGLYHYFSTVEVVNTVLWGNLPDQICDATDADTDVRFSTVENGWTGTGFGVLDTDPLFVRLPDPGLDGEWGTADDDEGDLRLDAGSPGVDAGTTNAVPPDALDLDDDGDTAERLPHDAAGAPRFTDDPGAADTGCGGSFLVDMGAYERAGAAANPVVVGDTDGNGVVDFVDLLEVLATWGPCPGGCCPGDLDDSGTVEFSDLLTLLAAWG